MGKNAHFPKLMFFYRLMRIKMTIQSSEAPALVLKSFWIWPRVKITTTSAWPMSSHKEILTTVCWVLHGSVELVRIRNDLAAFSNGC